MAQRGRRRASALVVASLVAMLGLAGGYAWLRATVPSEPAVVSIDDWDWSADGVEVVPLDGSSPFRAGDRVVAVDGVPLATLAGEAVTPWGEGAGPSEGAATRTFTVERGGTRVELEVPLAPQPIGGLLAAALALLTYTIAQAAVAVLAWWRRPSEGWRRGFVVGSVANVANAITWELGLRVTDLDRHEPMLLLFALGVPLHLLFWSSVAHVMLAWPTRAPGRFGGRSFIAAVYVVPQVVLVVGMAMLAWVVPSAPAWIGSAERMIAAVVLGQDLVVLATLLAAWLRIRTSADASLRIVVIGVFTGALAVGLLTVVPVLVTGQALAPRSGVAALGLPLALILVVGTFRSRLFEVDLLLASRRRLIVAREEERRRLRRDLHDGVGPMLAAMTLKADLARDLLRDDPAAADGALAALKADTQAALAEIRRLSRDLRPPVIDELGLAEAIRQRATELGQGSGEARLEVTVGADAGLPPLDAASEVAAYRIALEAMTNVVRHAGARRLDVRLAVRGGSLVLEIRDDGAGIAPDRVNGVGFTSMRERCSELGGRLAVERTADGWTVVRATIPLAG